MGQPSEVIQLPSWCLAGVEAILCAALEERLNQQELASAARLLQRLAHLGAGGAVKGLR